MTASTTTKRTKHQPLASKHTQCSPVRCLRQKASTFSLSQSLLNKKIYWHWPKERSLLLIFQPWIQLTAQSLLIQSKSRVSWKWGKRERMSSRKWALLLTKKTTNFSPHRKELKFNNKLINAASSQEMNLEDSKKHKKLLIRLNLQTELLYV